MISQETIQEIVSKINILDVVGEYVKLKKRGANYLGLCPFHNEKSPSFTVSPSKEIYKCFGCGKSGNSISFLMEHDKMSYVEALKWLAKKYSVTIEETASDPEYREQQQVADSLYIINQFATKFFETQLWENEMGQAVAYSYLEQRGFNDDTIKKFQLGYSPAGRSSFAEAAVKNQFNRDLLLKTGLVVLRDDQLVDNYRDRIIFPIHNPVGKVIGFGARLIRKNDKAPKYINTPENELYVKSKVLYGIHFSRQAIDKQDECLLVEGYTDVVSLHQAGVENVVASGGTSLTPDQLRLLKKYTNNLTIVYDGDNAGIKAALRGLDLALEEGLQVQLVLIPDGEDPDSYVNKVGKEAFIDFIKTNKKDFILFQLENALKDAGDDTRKRSEVVNRIAESISRINKAEDFTRQQDYIRKSAGLLSIDEGGLTTLVNKFIREKLEKAERKPAREFQQPAEGQTPAMEQAFDDSLSLIIGNEMQERAVVKCLLIYGIQQLDEKEKNADYIFRTLHPFHFDNPMLEKIYNTYKAWYDAGIKPTEKSFLYYGDEPMNNMVISLLEFPYELSPRWELMKDGERHLEKDAPVVPKKKFKAQEEKDEEDRLKAIHQRMEKDVKNSTDHFMLHKLKHMLEQNQQELLKTTDPDAQRSLLELHIALKKYETDITKVLGTVILR
ncbi:DNA primase [soil metagenome]